MSAPACMNPLFAEMIERHTGLKISPGNGSEELGGRTRESALAKEPSDEIAQRTRGLVLHDQVGGEDIAGRQLRTDTTSAQYLHYPILCMALLEENAILKQRLENLANAEAAMFPK